MNILEHREYQAWLDGLEEGDEVLMAGAFSTHLGRVARVTPTRRFTVSGGTWERRFHREGHEMTPTDTFRRLRLQPVTEEWREAQRRLALMDRIDKADLNSLDTETLRKIVALLPVPTE